MAKEEFENRHGSLCRATGENLNRLFPGKKEGTTYEKLAYAVVEELQKVADFYIDLHSGDDYEKLTPVYYAGKAAPEVMKISRQMAEQVDVPYMVKIGGYHRVEAIIMQHPADPFRASGTGRNGSLGDRGSAFYEA